MEIFKHVHFLIPFKKNITVVNGIGESLRDIIFG